MTVRFEDVLAALCSEVKLGHGNDSQRMFLVNDAKEARLSADVLIAHGFDVKIYPEKPASKLYIALPSPDDSAVEQKLSAALAYAGSLKQIRQTMDMLCRDNAAALQSPQYDLTFTSTLPAGKQITISFTPTRSDIGVSSPPIPAISAANNNAGNYKKPKKQPKATANQGFFYGPSVGEKSDILKQYGRLQSDSIWKQMYNYVGGHMEATIYGGILGIVFLIILFTLFTFSRALFCPDFAMARKHVAWYCTYNDNGQ